MSSSSKTDHADLQWKAELLKLFPSISLVRHGNWVHLHREYTQLQHSTKKGPCWAEVLNKDLNQNILALALYFLYDTEHRKTFQIFFAGDWQHALIQFCYLCWIYIPSLWFLCLHKLFSSHSAIKSDKTLTTHLSDTKRRHILNKAFFLFSVEHLCTSVKSTHCHEETTNLCLSLHFSFFLSATESMSIEGRESPESIHFLMNLKKTLK